MTAPKTVRVRIAVALRADGVYAARSYGSPEGVFDPQGEELEAIQYLRADGDDVAGVVWIEADAPLPEPVMVQGEVRAAIRAHREQNGGDGE